MAMLRKSEVVFLQGLLTLLFVSCSSEPDFVPQYAVKELQTPSGQKIYFKREVRGLLGNYDVIAISTIPEPCKSINHETDFCICSGAGFYGGVFYKFEDNVLHLRGSNYIDEPKSKNFPVKIKYDLVSDDFLKNHSKEGFSKLDLTLEGKCY
jgi:hypothetical protein